MSSFQFQGYTLETILLAASILLTVSVLASRISSSFGVPALLIFLGVGMLAGSEGPGGIAFGNYRLAFAIGSICLAFIIFDGGMSTSLRSVKPILPLGISLSIVGTFVTGVVTGCFARYVLGMSWIDGLLLGAIVSSTDAAAVFGILRARSLSLKGRLKQTLEFEAGSNDPMAIFLTAGVIMIATTENAGALSLAKMFITQCGLGLVFGALGARGIRWLVNHVGIEYEGLYGVLLLGLVMVLFSGTSALGGSGFLAVYVAGIILGNSEMLHKSSISKFIDGIGWISQIIVFLTLGLLVFPSHLVPLWREGLLLSLFMMFLARPFSVMVAAPIAKLNLRERTFVSWIGLRGAAPIILATLPWSVGYPSAEYLFNLVFFVVLSSVIAQGISVTWVAKKLGVAVPFREKHATEISAGMLPAGFVTVEIEVLADAPSLKRRVLDLGLPAGVLLTSLERNERYIVPRGDTVLEGGDKIWALARPSNIRTLRDIFGEAKIVT